MNNGNAAILDELKNLVEKSEDSKFEKLLKDCEFYIPQFVSFLCDHSQIQDIKENLTNSLLLIARKSFYFSHKLLFYINSQFINPELDEEEKKRFYKEA